MEKRHGSNVARYQHLPFTASVSNSPLSQAELSSLNSLRAWGERQQSCHDIAFLSVLTWEEATGDRKCGLSTVWVGRSQARVPSMEKVVGKQTAWASSGPNWPYTLVQLHEGTHHAPLHKEGHLGILPQRGWKRLPAGKSANSKSANCSSLVQKLPTQ